MIGIYLARRYLRRMAGRATRRRASGPPKTADWQPKLGLIMARFVDGLNISGPIGIACLALICIQPSAARGQIVGPGVYGWVYSLYGGVGNGNTNQCPSSTPAAGLSGVNVIEVAAGAMHSVPLTDTGSVFAWGINDAGELGIGTTTPPP